MRNRYVKPLVGVELGVFHAENALDMLRYLPMKKLFLVDPYLPYVDGDGAVWNNSDTDFQIAQKNLEGYSQCEFIRKSSVDAADELPDDLDFVYIDANHNYEPALADMATYYPKVRVGGVLGGHDFYSDYQGVIFAAVDFSRRVGAKLFVESPDWWIVKG